MGYLKPNSSNKSVNKEQDYLEKNSRAEKKTTLNIDRPNEWAKDMALTKMMYGKTDGRQYKEFIQSFDNEPNNPNYNVETVHKLGQELAQRYAEQGYQVVITTHNDTENLHNHIIINSVNSLDGRKFQQSKQEFKELQQYNDELCSRYGLRTLDESKAIKDERDRKNGKQPTTRSSAEYYIKSGKDKVRESLQKVFADTSITNDQEFNQALSREGLMLGRETSTGNITYLDREGNKHRGSRLGAFNRIDIQAMYTNNLRFKVEKEFQKGKVYQKRENGLTGRNMEEKRHLQGREGGMSR